MHGDLASITPPITVPAWACAMTGKTPGQLGLYGFRNRKDTRTKACRSRTPARSTSAAGVGQARRGGHALAAHRRPTQLPAAEGVPRVACRLLPHSAQREALRLPAGARGRGRRGAGRQRQLHLRHPELPPAGDAVRPRSGVHDDRAPVQGGAAAGEGQAVGLLHDGRDGAGPAPPRVLAVLRSGAPALRGRQPLRDRVPGLLPLPGRRGRRVPGAASRGRDHDRDVRPRRPADDGRPLLQRLADAGGLPHDDGAGIRADPDRAMRRSTGAARSHGATAATTGAAS